MKKLVGYPVSWVLWTVGHALSKVMDVRYMAWIYHPYNRCMEASGDIQDWSNCDGPWSKAMYDGCEVCGGTKGGVPGNENVIEGIVMCDYCHSDQMK